MDLQTFRTWLPRAMSGDPDVPPVMLSRVNSVRQEYGANVGNQDEHWWETQLWLLEIRAQLELIQRQIEELNRIAGEYDRMALDARERMREVADRLERIDDFISGADDVLDRLLVNGKLDREKALKLLQSSGINMPPGAPDEGLAAELRRQQIEAQRERTRWSEAHDELERDAKRYEEQAEEIRRKARELEQRREGVLQRGLTPAEEAVELRGLTGEVAKDIEFEAAGLESESAKVWERRTGIQEAEAASQTKDEELDFMAAADGLVGHSKGATDPGAISAATDPGTPLTASQTNAGVSVVRKPVSP
jgi:hypothetical protein